jgi:peptidoglycan/LPS O-acetylase OafA/YrhL
MSVTHQSAPPLETVARPPAQRRLRDLDSLRGIAASCVLLFHFSYLDDFWHQWPVQVRWGHYGVELFFVISGFVIFMTLEKSTGVTEFLISRVTRLYPAYWCAVLLTSGSLLILNWPKAPTLVAVVANLTMLQSFMQVVSIDPSYWTLTIELIFYVSIVAWYRLRIAGLQRIEWYALGWIVTAATLRTILIERHTTVTGIFTSPILLYYGQFFIIGICLYRRHSGGFSPITLFTLLAACAMSLFGGGPASQNAEPVPYFLVTCTVTLLVLLASDSRLSILRNSLLLFLGDISYPLYLVHQKVGQELMALAHARHYPTWLSLPSIVLALIAVAWLIHIGVEVPGRTLLRARLRRIMESRAPLGDQQCERTVHARVIGEPDAEEVLECPAEFGGGGERSLL